MYFAWYRPETTKTKSASFESHTNENFMTTEKFVLDLQHLNGENTENPDDDEADNSKYDRVKRKKEPSLAMVLTKVMFGVPKVLPFWQNLKRKEIFFFLFWMENDLKCSGNFF